MQPRLPRDPALSMGAGIYMTLAQEREDYPLARRVLASMLPWDLRREWSEALTGCFGLFRGNGQRYMRLVEEEMLFRGWPRDVEGFPVAPDPAAAFAETWA